MIALAKYKQLLGTEAEHLSDIEIEELRTAHYQMARVAFALWKENHLQKNDVARKK